MSKSLSHVRTWIFDLDNTLYARECNLWAQIDLRISDYMMRVTGLPYDAARRLQKDYYRNHGTTLNGLMARHDVDPDHFLADVHAIDYSPVPAHPELIEQIEALPGRKFILTNGDVPHAQAVLRRLGAHEDLFEDIFDIRAMGFKPKPLRHAYDAFLAAHGVDPSSAAMFDDLEKNLLVPHETGMVTVQVVATDDYAHEQADPWELHERGGAHVHHVTSDLSRFLRQLP